MRACHLDHPGLHALVAQLFANKQSFEFLGEKMQLTQHLGELKGPLFLLHTNVVSQEDQDYFIAPGCQEIFLWLSQIFGIKVGQ